MRFRRQQPPRGHERLGAAFLVATVEPRPGQVLEDDLTSAMRSLTDDADRRVLPLFTSEYALTKIYPHGSAWVSVQLSDALRLFVDGDWDVVVVDPDQQDAEEFSRADAELLLTHAAEA